MIHSTAIVHPQAALGANVSVGAYSIIGEAVEIGDGTAIGPHTIIEGPTRIGRDNRIGSFTALGGPPQDKSYRGEPTRLEIGDRNTIREYCSFNRGTMKDAQVTRVGDDNWIMGYVHLAHDCQIGSNTVLREQHPSRRPCAHRRLGDPGRVYRRAPVRADRGTRDDRRRDDAAAGRPAVRHRRR